jgi:hypothetical protein
MIKVFIGGSRHISRLPASVRQRLDRIIERGLPAIIGDANGADKAVQNYLSARHYQNVEVYCSGRLPRNNVGGWLLRPIAVDERRGTVEFYTAKDRAMTDDATIGFMVWDGKSAGTLLNVFRLLSQQKKVVVYIGPKKQFEELKTLSQWDEFISRCPSELRSKVEERVVSERNGSLLQPPPRRRVGALAADHR